MVKYTNEQISELYKKKETKIKFSQENPKTKKNKESITQTWDRYEKYKKADTIKEFINLGGKKIDFTSAINGDNLEIIDEILSNSSENSTNLSPVIEDVVENEYEDINKSGNIESENIESVNIDNLDISEENNEQFKPDVKVGDVIDKLKELPEESIDMFLTSPPY